MSKMNKSVVIIGGGLGGLFCGAILAKEGCKVTILEKNATIGGGLQSFRRFGETFDTGMHIVGGMRSGGNIWRICRYLGIDDSMRLLDVDNDCTDHLYFAEDRQWYTIAQGNEGFVESLARDFPDERQGLRRYVEAVQHIADSIGLFNLRPAEKGMPVMPSAPHFTMAANDFIAQFVGDRRLRSVLAYMNPLYGGRPGQTPAFVHAIVSTLYIKGASRFVGGSSRFADLLAEVIRSRGGNIVAGDAVEWIEVRDRRVDHVRTKKGHVYRADCYISDIHPCTLLTLMDGQTFTKAFRERMNAVPNAYSAFSLFIKLRQGTFPYINHSEFYMTRYDDVWNFARTDRPWPLGFLFMTPPEDANTGTAHNNRLGRQDGWTEGATHANKAMVTAPMPFSMARAWEHTTTGHRDASYYDWKAQMTEALLRHVEEIHPGFSRCIEAVNSASPLTIRDFYGVKEGTICGFSKDCTNMALSHLPVVTKVGNLLLTGQNNNLHGFCGVPLTAINTCEAILGTNYVLNKMGQC